MMRLICSLALVVMCACEPPIPVPVVPPPPPTEPPSDAELLAARRYSVEVPKSYDGGVALPLVIALHGYGGTGLEVSRYYDLDRLFESRGFFLIAPNGLQDARGNRAWHPSKSRWPEWDRSWLTAVIREVKERYQVDASRVIVFGASQGAHMAHRMGCDSADEVTALISVAGQVPNDCAPSKVVSALVIHGTADETIGYEADPQKNLPGAHETAGSWARSDGCSGQLEVAPVSPIDVSLFVDGDETVVENYAGCPDGVDVTLWSMQGVPHRPLPTADFGARAIGFGLARPREQ